MVEQPNQAAPADIHSMHSRSLAMNCAVIGVKNMGFASNAVAVGLYSLQHRGEETCGISAYESKSGQYYTERRLGLVGDHFGNRRDDKEEALPNRLFGNSAIGHTRYSTTGQKKSLQNAQPLYANTSAGEVALAHNGNLTNALQLRRKLESDGAIFHTTVDTEVILHLLSRSSQPNFLDKLKDALAQVEGGYAIVGMNQGMMFALRDPQGIRPLVMGRNADGATIFASESCALDVLGTEFVRDLRPGELVVCGENEQPKSVWTDPRAKNNRPPRTCMFEYVYFARPDSIVDGIGVYQTRQRMGQELARQCTNYDESLGDNVVVVPVPDSGVPAAMGYAQESGFDYQLGIIRNHYVGRTFILPNQENRAEKVQTKHNVNRAVVAGKKVILVDDSIVRGNTSRNIVRMMHDAGAAEVHFRVACPEIKYPDYYGIDMPSIDDLLAATTIHAGMMDMLKVLSLYFLDIDRLYLALCEEKRDPAQIRFSDHCFTGDYPTPLADKMAELA